LEKQARRTDREFLKSIKALHEQSHVDGRPDSVVNIDLIKVIIYQIEKGPVKEARALIEECSSNQPRVTRTSSEIRNGPFERPNVHTSPSLTSLEEIRSPNHDDASISRHASPQHRTDELPNELPTDTHTGSLGFMREDNRFHNQENTPLGGTVYHDYGDGSRMTYELDESASHGPDNIGYDNSHVSDSSRNIYQPMPPFDEADLRGRKKRFGSQREE
jgi:hypothetical protein